jgi:hypothetical protein
LVQEVRIAAVKSGDGNLLEACESGDVYMGIATQLGFYHDVGRNRTPLWAFADRQLIQPKLGERGTHLTRRNPGPAEGTLS